ncbi:ABC transporter ATP-binding protein [Blastococcus sp. Marseille-P5729]|uniref:ABC transporter ATP-binding protein n=1 Tax=Blastococcus sp. Marseille-P5729 TaxID=2086582 RepID=UPI000D0F46B0|nr:ATP-binding cassette domain-containing protein [Blastococcus sp. Marseille-P5729]
MLGILNVDKQFGDKVVLRDLSFEVRPGELFGFCGANGSGKTTTMRIILGLLRADRGEITWNGAPMDAETRQSIGYMPEERGLYPKMRPAEQLAYFAQLHGMPADEAKRSADYWIERLGVKHEPKDTLEKLSLGNQQKVQMAAALVHDPKILVLDEPFSGLDPVAVDALLDALTEKARAGAPVIFSSHQLDLVERLCDSVGIISGGRMVAAGPVDSLRAKESRKQLLLTVAGAQPGWARQLPHVVEASETGTSAVLTPTSPEVANEILQAALAIGAVERFVWKAPTLTEIFREAVAA